MIIVLNGPSSSGKTSISAELADILEADCLRISIDDFIDSLPSRLYPSPDGLSISAEGEVSTGPAFDRLYGAWLAAMGRLSEQGIIVVYDDVLSDPAEAQAKMAEKFGDANAFWVALDCDVEKLRSRESQRGDRPCGMAERQLNSVDGRYQANLRVDSGKFSPRECAELIANALPAPSRRA